MCPETSGLLAAGLPTAELLTAGLLTLRARAMATEISVQARSGVAGAEELARAGRAALALFGEVEASCSRFLPDSALTQANEEPDRWHVVPAPLAAMLAEARRAHHLTAGVFDPRVLRALVALGYARRLPRGEAVGVAAPAPSPVGPWHPRLRPATGAVHLGGVPVDLGGIGKGLTVRWASERLAAATDVFLVEAGGDCYCAGGGPDDGLGWRIGIEDPGGAPAPCAVLRVSDRAVATSSIRVRRWRVGGEAVHHLIDPRTGRPGGDGLLAVTVVGRDPALSEVWSKVLFLAGAAGIAARAAERGLAAYWIETDGRRCHSAACAPYLCWEAP